MKKRRVLVFTLFALLFMAGTAAIVWHNETAFAKGKNTKGANSINAQAVMGKYAPPKSKNNQGKADAVPRRSRLSQMNIISEAAQVLNILPVNIIDEMKNGKTLVQIAKEKGLTKADFLKQLKAYENKTVDAAVTAGTITKEHAKAIKAGQNDRLTKSLTIKSVNVNDHQAMDMGN